MASVFMMAEGDDAARRAWHLRKKIRQYQESFTALEKVRGGEGGGSARRGGAGIGTQCLTLCPPISCSAPNL